MRRWQAHISLAMALVIGLVTLGVAPTPAGVRRALGIAGEPFPCEDHACGCSSADDCFDDCCCFTDAQIAAWAAQRGVPPGRFGVAAGPDEHCELCEATDGPAPAAEPAEAPPLTASLISALSCRGVKLTIAWAPPLLAAPQVRLPIMAPAPAERAGSGPLHPPGQRALDVPSPPPRA
ncbi:MAG: hypothetical protein ACF8R7_15615 [Phycisphaerales bacterium JB039]